MTDKEKMIVIIMLMFTSLTIVTNKKPKIQKLNQRILDFLKKEKRKDPEVYTRLGQKSHDTWESSKNIIAGDDMVSMSHMLLTLDILLTDNKHHYDAYTVKIFDRAYNSFVGDNSFKAVYSSESNSKKLIDMFSEKLSIKRDNGLKRLFLTMNNNRIIEGKEAWKGGLK